jgi:hypothetical protein
MSCLSNRDRGNLLSGKLAYSQEASGSNAVRGRNNLAFFLCFIHLLNPNISRKSPAQNSIVSSHIYISS